MRRWFIFISLLLLAFATFFVLIFLRPSLWTGQLMSYFNSQIEQRYNVHIEAARLTGNILNNLSGEDVVVTTGKDSTFFTAQGLTLQYSLWKIIIGEFAIDEIHINKPVIYYTKGLDLLVSQMHTRPPEQPAVTPLRQQFTIDRLTINEGQFIYQSTANPLNVNKITGEMQISQGFDALSITGDFSSIQPLAGQQQLRSIQFLLHQYPDSITVDHMEFMYDSAFVFLDGVYEMEPQPHLRMKYHFSNVAPQTILSDFGVQMPVGEQWDITGNLHTDFVDYHLHTTFSGNWKRGVRSSGELQTEFSENHLKITSSDLRINDGRVRIQGEFREGAGGNANVEVERLNLADLAAFLPQSSLSGGVKINEDSGDLRDPNVNMHLNFQETGLQGYPISHVLGDIRLQNDTVRTVDTLQARFGNSQVNLSGWYGFDQSFNASVKLTTDDLTSFSSLFSIPGATGNLTARLQMQGTFDSTAVKGGVSLTNFQTEQAHLDTLVSYLDFANLQRLEGGNLFVEARNGDLFGKTIESGNLYMESTRDSFVVHNLRLNDARGSLYLTGRMSKNFVGAVNTLQLRYKDVLLHNRTTLPVRLTNQGLQLDRGVLSINDGFIGVAGIFRNPDSLQVTMDITNLDLAPLNALLMKTLPFTGNLNGNIEFRRIQHDQAIRTDLNLTNAIWHDVPYEEIQCRGNYYQGVLALTRGALKTPEGATLEMSGKIPLLLETSLKQDSLVFAANQPLTANIELQDIYLEDYTKFLALKQKIAGKISGDMSISGTMEAPLSKMSLSVSDPKFDRVGGENLQVEAAYGHNRLTFTSLELNEREEGLYTGHGYLPLEVNLAAGKLRLMRDTQMDLRFHADTPQLQFLEQYIKDLDGMTGTCTLDLAVTGTPNHPLRNGTATIEDGILEISQLENEVTGVNAGFTLTDNLMSVDHFSAYMHDTQRGEIIEGVLQRARHWLSGLFRQQVSKEKPNVFVEGTLNFQKFFKPGLNLRLTGQDVYIRTLLSEIEGLVNTDITLVGRDTLRITGDLEVAEEVVLRKEFTKREFPKEIQTGGKKKSQVEINLHADFPGNVYIKNGQVNAEFEGEIWLIQHGREPLNISGSLTVLNGKFYYYNDTFTIEEGEISFDPVDSNPRLNVVATTQIEKEPIRITLTGELDNPTIALEATGDANLSESDILSLLTFNSQVEQGGLVSPELQSIFTTYLERQLENYGTQLMGLETFEVETQGQGLQDLQQVSITVGQRVSPNLYFLYGRDFLAVNPGSRLGLEYRVNKYVSFVGEIDEDGLYHFNYRLKYNY